MMEIVLMENNIRCTVMIYFVSINFNLLPNYEAGKKQSCYDQKLVNHFLGHVHTKIASKLHKFSLKYNATVAEWEG